MFHTVYWLYALYPITWFLATLSNVGALFFHIPRDIKKISEEAANLDSQNA